MNYLAKFSLDTSDLTKGITGAAIAFDAIRVAAKLVFDDMKAGFDATAGAALDFAEKIHTLADISGDTEENIQRLRAAAVATGTSFDDVTTSMRLFSQRLGDTGTVGDDLRAKLKEIGVQIYDNNGNYKNASELMLDVNSKANAMSSTFERNALLNDVYGRSWYNIIDMISRAPKAMQAAEQANVYTDKDIADAKELGLQIEILEGKFEKVGRTIGFEVLPATQEWVDLIEILIEDTGPVTDAFGALNDVLTLSARGFHIVAMEADIAWKTVHGDFAGAKAAAQEMNNWIQATQTKDALKASGFTPEDYEKKTSGLSDQEKADAAAGKATGGAGSEVKYGSDAYTPEQIGEMATRLGVSVEEVKSRLDAAGEANKYGVSVDQLTKKATTGDSSHTDMTVMDSIMQNLGGYGDKYGQVDAIFQNAGSLDQTNYYAQQINSLSARAKGASGGLGSQGLDWRYTGENEEIANATLAAAKEYARTTNIYVNVPEGTPADMADRVAAAISRALAQQVTT